MNNKTNTELRISEYKFDCFSYKRAYMVYSGNVRALRPGGREFESGFGRTFF